MDAPKLVVGTAGHIDHGKSRLVWALTGTNPDRLPEEQARGMTIDLGFAFAAIDGADIFLVDVPGHERFIRNMVAGATGIDVALLVVAADDSVMPQTREHAELLSLLGVERCVVVLTKMDLVDEEWADAVAQEACDLLASLQITALSVVKTSAQTGRGLDELRATLARLARERAARDDGCRWFRLPIDRAFTVPGRGTVVTGTVAHGAVKSDDELELWPAGRRVRVRDLQSHSEGRSAVAGKMRLAVNLAGVSLDEVRRGCELATPGYLEASSRFDVSITSLRAAPKARRSELRLRLHIATSEVLATLRMFDEGEAGLRFGRLRTAEPIVASWGQRFILRDESGMRTVGGGRVINPAPRLTRSASRPAAENLSVLRDGKPKQRLERVVAACEWDACDEARLSARAGLPDAAVARSQLRELEAEGRVRALRGEAGGLAAHVHSTVLGEVSATLSERLKRWLGENPRAAGLPRGEWAGWMPRACPARLRAALADWLIAQGEFVDARGFLLPRGHARAISADDERLLAAILAEFEAGAFQPPALEELRCRTDKNAKRVRELVELAAVRGELVRIADGIWLRSRHARELVECVTRAIRERGPLTVADIRTLLNSTRKYVVPIVGHLDATGVTRRQGDLRSLGPKAAAIRAG